jgi:putative two-component system response regulator
VATSRILLVEDEPVSLQILQMVIASEASYEAIAARSVGEALVQAERSHPALIISDRFLGAEDGLDLCRKVKADPALKNIMFMLLTSASETVHKITGLDAGADDYITKPYNDDELLSRIRALLRIKALQDDLWRDKAELERANRSLQESLSGITNLLTNIIELRVPNARERARRASDLVRWMGERLDLDRPTSELLQLAARIHEIGKISVPDEILGRPSAQLAPGEAEALSHFPLFGQMIVGTIPQLKAIGRMLRHQMENYDGTGYPDRLMRTEIPLAARILRIANLLEELAVNAVTETSAVVERLRGAQGTVLEPRLAQLAEEYLVAVSSEDWMRDKSQVGLDELEEGMVLAADISAVSGMKLMARDSRLSRAQVEYLRAHHRTDPVAHGIYVFTPQPSAA